MQNKWVVFVNHLYWYFNVKNCADSIEGLKVNYVSIILLWISFCIPEQNLRDLSLCNLIFQSSKVKKSLVISTFLFASLAKVIENQHVYAYN